MVQNIIDKETWRQYSGLELIASEVRDPAWTTRVARCMTMLSQELDIPCNDGSERLHIDQQVLRGSPTCAVLRW